MKVKVKPMGQKWGIDYTYMGKRKRQVISSRKSDAEKVATKIEAEIFHNKHCLPRNNKIKFKDFAKKYLEEYSIPINSPNRARANGSVLRRLTPFFGELYLHEITSYYYDQYRKKRISQKAKKTGKPISKYTVNTESGVLRALLNQAIKWGDLNFNPLEKMETYKVERRDRVLTKDEIKILVTNAKQPLKNIILVALNTGMRRGEILNLAWNQVNVKDGFITVRNTKSRKSRKIPMNPPVYKILSELEQTKGDNHFVFENPNTQGPFKAVNRLWYALMKKTGITDFRFHDLRHCFATYALFNGGDIISLKETLGHSNLATTSIYIKAMMPGQQKLVNGFSVSENGEEMKVSAHKESKIQSVDFQKNDSSIGIEDFQDGARKGEIIEFPNKERRGQDIIQIKQ